MQHSCVISFGMNDKLKQLYKYAYASWSIHVYNKNHIIFRNPFISDSCSYKIWYEKFILNEQEVYELLTYVNLKLI